MRESKAIENAIIVVGYYISVGALNYETKKESPTNFNLKLLFISTITKKL